jgi:hypothetical protein
VEHPAARGLGLPLGRVEPVSAGGRDLVGSGRRRLEDVGRSRRCQVGRRRRRSALEHEADSRLHARQLGAAVPVAG